MKINKRNLSHRTTPKFIRKEFGQRQAIGLGGLIQWQIWLKLLLSTVFDYLDLNWRRQYVIHAAAVTLTSLTIPWYRRHKVFEQHKGNKNWNFIHKKIYHICWSVSFRLYVKIGILFEMIRYLLLFLCHDHEKPTVLWLLNAQRQQSIETTEAIGRQNKMLLFCHVGVYFTQNIARVKSRREKTQHFFVYRNLSQKLRCGTDHDTDSSRKNAFECVKANTPFHLAKNKNWWRKKQQTNTHRAVFTLYTQWSLCDGLVAMVSVHSRVE